MVFLFLTLNSYMQYCFPPFPTLSKRKFYGSKFDLHNLERPKHITKASGHAFKKFLQLFVAGVKKVKPLVFL